MISHELVYLDHPSTSWPKPAAVTTAVIEALSCAGSPARGAHQGAREAERRLREARRSAADFFGVTDARNLVFVPGATYGLNLVLRGLCEPGDRVAVFCGEHNAVTRPLGELAQLQDVELRWIGSDSEGVIDLTKADAALREAPTKLLVCQQASNVTGALQPLAELAALAHAQGTLLVVDGAQTAGHLPLDLETSGADAWVCSGHKALRGPAGSGLVWLSPDTHVLPLITGGTGAGERFADPFTLQRPGDYEAGTVALPAYCGLGAALDALAEVEAASHATERQLIARLIEGLKALDIPTLHLIGPADVTRRVPLVSCFDDRIPSERLAYELDHRFNIATRAGRHCAPSLYDALGLPASGTLRMGVGPENTPEEIDYAVESLGELLSAV